MEQEGEKINEKKMKEDDTNHQLRQEDKPKEDKPGHPEISSTNPQGGIHQQGGATSSGIVQGGEHDQPMEEPRTRKRKTKQQYTRISELNYEIAMKET